jgi:PAS domain S-box-containing protein
MAQEISEHSEAAPEERLRALEASLRERERQLMEAHRIARLGTWRWECATDRVTWSEEVYRAFGLDPKQPPPGYESLRAMHEPASGRRLQKAVAHTLATGEPYELDLEIQAADGSARWLIARGEVEVYAGGKPAVLRGTIQDITERKRNEQRSHQLYQHMYVANLIGICYPDRFGAFSDGNAEFLRVVGYSEEDLRAGRVRWDVMTPPEYAALDAEHIVEAAQRGNCTPYEKEFIRKDGTRVPILCGYALREGSSDEYIGFIMDISPVKQAEAALREREQRFSALAESLPELVWMSNPNGERVYTSKRYQEYTGMKSEELMGSRWRQLLHPDDLPHTDALWQRCMESGELYQNEYRIRRHDGLYRSFLVRGVAVRNEAGEIEQWVGSATDIHDRKLAEEAVRRTEKLAAAGRLAASIAHEINNPLAAVMNSLYLALMDEDLGATTRQYLKTAEQELARAAHVTTQTLQFHRQTSSPRPADLAAVMESAFGLFATRFNTSDVLVVREYKVCTLLYCYGDELRQVFANLLSNALDAMRQGGRLRIRMREAHSWPTAANAVPRSGLRVTLADTGQGIPAEVMARLFEPFLSTKEATGTGLGLWVSEGIVKKHQGLIRVRSRVVEPARGTVFSLFFPMDGLGR